MDGSKRRGSYPIQTSDYTPTISSPKPFFIKETPARLPSSIRALRDAQDASHHGRTVIICLDGTGDRFDNDNSNVVHFVSCLKKHTPDHQVTYYQSGIGTYDKGGLKNGLGAVADMAVGSGLGIHIKDAYRFLMQNYREGDKICLLGFSRGAYTVRCLAGMLHKVGLLPASNGAQVNFAYDFYKDDSPEGWKMSAEFKMTFCTNVSVYFVGLWDCVASVGFIPRKLPFSKSPTNSIHYFRHAMALDEHRSKFKVCQWQHQDPDIRRRETIDNTPKAEMRRGLERINIFRRQKTATERTNSNGSTETHRKPPVDESLRRSSQGSELSQEKLEAYFEAYEASHSPRHHRVKTDALEVWFIGAHSNVGGGAVANDERHKLSQIPLRWMIRQCFACDTGILFDTARLVEQGLDIHSIYPTYHPPQKPSCGPAPALVERYEKKKLPPLRWRRALLSIGENNDNEEIDNPFTEACCEHHVSLLSESSEDHFDALAPVNDQLKEARGWWILEFWPVKIRVLVRGEEGWEKKVRMNMGRYRAIRETEPKMHWTVQRMVDEGKYAMKCRVDRNTVWQIVA